MKVIKLNSYLTFFYDVIILLKDGTTRFVKKGSPFKERKNERGKRIYSYLGFEIVNFHKF